MKINPSEALAASIILLILNFYIPPLAIILSVLFNVILVWKADPIYCPAILILVLSPVNFLSGKFGSSVYSSIPMGGFYLTVSFSLVLSIWFRIIYEYLFRNRKGINGFEKKLFFLWLSAFFPSSVISIKGLLEGNNGWSLPILAMFVTGSFFYGILLSEKWTQKQNIVGKNFNHLITIILIFAVIGQFHHRILWLFASLVPGLSFLAWNQKKTKLSGFLQLTLIGAYCMGYGIKTTVDSGIEGSESTFTLMGLFMLSLLLNTVVFYSAKDLKKIITSLMGFPIIIICLVFVYFVAGSFQVEKKSGSRNAYTVSIKERLVTKIYEDRASVWNSNIKYITTPPYFFKPAGRSVEIESSTGGYKDVNYGAHNAYIQSVRLNGWYSGLINIVILIFAILCSARILRRSKIREIRILSISTILQGTFASMTGHYPVSINAGFWIFVIAGISYGIFLKEDTQLSYK